MTLVSILFFTTYVFYPCLVTSKLNTFLPLTILRQLLVEIRPLCQKTF